MPQQEITCIGCPLGCRVTLRVGPDGDIENLNGNQCKEGKKYVTAEFQYPVRVFTATVLTEGSGRLLSVRTDKPVSKSQLKELMRAIDKIRVKPPVKIGQEVVHDILGTGANLVSTGTL
jgi:CxxC motif-containing protein